MEILKMKIVLASNSPRRKRLLTEAGFDIVVRTTHVEESYPENLPSREVAPFLARKKALASRHLLTGEDVLLAADSVVLLQETIFGKPRDAGHATEILRALSGRTHEVITGVCLLDHDREKVFSGLSRVHMKELTEEEIHYYVQKFQPFDKAGSYAIQEWIGLCKISGIEGTYSNIMGLPMAQVYEELTRFLA